MCYLLFFFFNVTSTTSIYTLSLHDALPISIDPEIHYGVTRPQNSMLKVFKISGLSFTSFPDQIEETAELPRLWKAGFLDRKSTRLNSSHSSISYAVFCLKKKN